VTIISTNPCHTDSANPHPAGAPSLNFLAAMEQEHCSGEGSRERFITTNYGISTCPADEWAVVAGASGGADASGGRVVPCPERLVRGETARRAGLQLAEVFAVVLYTGPMVRGPWPCQVRAQAHA
jgi:hypothetical protein